MSEAPLGLEVDEFGRLVCIIPGSVSPFPELRPEDKLARLMAGREKDGELANDFLDDLKRGFDLDSVRQLLEAEHRRAASCGLFLLDELASRAAPLRDVAIRLADGDTYKRRVFMHFCINTHLIDDEIVAKLARRLDDPDLRIRVLAMQWIANADPSAVETLWRSLEPEEKLSLDALLVPWSSSRFRERALRAFRIGIEIKLGRAVRDIKEEVPFEDSYTFDLLSKLSVKIRPMDDAER